MELPESTKLRRAHRLCVPPLKSYTMDSNVCDCELNLEPQALHSKPMKIAFDSKLTSRHSRYIKTSESVDSVCSAAGTFVGVWPHAEQLYISIWLRINHSLMQMTLVWIRTTMSTLIHHDSTHRRIDRRLESLAGDLMTDRLAIEEMDLNSGTGVSWGKFGNRRLLK